MSSKKTAVQIDKSGSTDDFVKTIRFMAKSQSEIVEQLKQKMSGGDSNEVIGLLDKLETTGSKVYALAKFVAIAQGQIFQLFLETWGELPESFTANYSDCYDYIEQKFGVGDQMADMYATIWDGLFSGKYKVEPPTYIHLGRLPVVKMRVLASHVIRGEMTDKKWKMVANDGLTRSQLASMLRGEDGKMKKLRGPEPDPKDKTVLLRGTGDVRKYTVGDIKHIGVLDIQSPDAAVREEIRRICKESGIQVVR